MRPFPHPVPRPVPGLSLQLLGLLAPFAPPFPPRTRDPKDDYLLAYALRDGADVLVTGDRDLLDSGDVFAPLRIVDPGEFVRELGARGLIDRSRRLNERGDSRYS